MTKKLQDWLDSNKLDFQIEGFICYSDKLSLLLLQEKNGRIFDEEFQLIVSEEEERVMIENKIEYYLFSFGKNFYFHKKGKEKVELELFCDIGEVRTNLRVPFIHLGVHGGYEILNGSRDYKDWCKKTKFYGGTSLGICERNTLAGIMEFQLSCEKYKIQPILGEEIVIENSLGERYVGKVYVSSLQGWRNLLLINTEINVINQKFILEDRLLELSTDLVFVFNCETVLSRELIQRYKKSSFIQLYYQIDSVIWDNDDRDRQYLLNIKNYIENYSSLIKCILINDSYYLRQEDFDIKRVLNRVGGLSHQNISKDQYYKNLDDNYILLSTLFKDDEQFLTIFSELVDSTVELSQICNYQIELGKLYLPLYEMNEEQRSKFATNEDLFWFLIEEGISKKLIGKVNNLDEYLDRLDMECKVIKKGSIIDYFLILWDIIIWANKNDILTGIGRGSAGGSLVAYVMDLTRVDPLPYGLLFERFLNEGRIGKSLPDIDIDFQANRKEEVKQYIKSKYGANYFCSIGTYTTLQLKAIIQDLGRELNIDKVQRNYITKILDDRFDRRFSNGKFTTIFENAVEVRVIRDFVQSNTDLIENIPLCLDQPRAQSVHPCATVIIPKGRDIFEWIPVRKEGEELVSEWEGSYIETLGLLKEDILGIRQLDKFRFIIDLVKQDTGVDLDIYNLPMDDRDVFEYFRRGWNEDLFHFGSKGLTSYCIQVQPDTIHELIAIIALYRPGTMYVGSHTEYLNLKHGRKKIEYDFGLEEITKDTYSLIIYQEQVMKICQELGGFSLVEADGIRKAMGKMLPELIATYKTKFLDYAIQVRNCPKETAEMIWHKMEVFAEYSFNKSHSAAYAITGYICQWLKVHYPVQYWTAALEFAREEKISDFLFEIENIDNYIKISPPDVNHSRLKFYNDYKKGKIYWTLSKIKFVGDTASKFILDEREKNGEFFDFSEFCNRIDKSKVNKRVVENLIFAGGFDEIEKIVYCRERKRLFEWFYNERDVELPDRLELRDEEWWWLLRQREVCGYTIFNYRDIVKQSEMHHLITLYVEVADIFTERFLNKKILVGGIVEEIIEKKGKKGTYGTLTIDSNNKKVSIICWSEVWSQIQKKFIGMEGKIVVFSGRVKFDSNRQTNNIQIEDSSEFLFLV